MEALILEKQPLALGAYSTKILRRDYQRALMRVRRLADSAQADVRADANGEISLDSKVKIASGSSSATTLGEFVANASYTDVDSLGSPSASTVSIWYDQSGSNRHLTQTVTNYQPRITTTSGTVYQSDSGPNVLFWPTTVDPKYMDCRELVGDFTVHMGFRLLGPTTSIKLYDGTNDLIEASRSTNTVSISQISSSSMVLNGYDKKAATSTGYASKANSFLTVSGTFASTGNTRIGGNSGGLTDLYIYPKAKKGKQRREVEAVSSRENSTPLAYSNRQDIDTTAFLNKFEGAAAAFSLRSLNNSSDTKLAKVRRTVDNKEAIVFPDSSGYVSLESPVRWWYPRTTGVTTPQDYTSKATLLGQFVGDSSYTDVDSLGSPSSAHVVELFDQATQNEVFGRRLLDYHTGAEAAYSFRRVSTAYTGPCMEVSVFISGSVVSTSDIEFDDSGSVIANLNEFYNQKLVQYGSPTAFGFALSKWYDQSGNGRDLIQPTPANMLQITYSEKNGEVGVVGINGVYNMSTSAFSVAAPFSYSLSFDNLHTTDCDIIQFDTNVAAGISSSNYVAKDGANTVIAGAAVSQKVKTLYGVHDSASSEVGLDGSYTTGSNLTNGVTSIKLFPTSGPLVTVYDFILWGENKSTDGFSKEDIELYSKDLYRSEDPNAKAIASTAQPKIYDATNGLITDGGRVAMEATTDNYFLFSKDRIAGESNVSSFVSLNTSDARGYIYGLDGSYKGPYINSLSNPYTVGFGSPSTFVDSKEETIVNSVSAYDAVSDGTKKAVSLINADASAWTASSETDITLFNFLRDFQSNDTLTGKYHEFVFFTTDVSADRDAIETDINSAFGSYSLANVRRQEKLLNQFPGAAAAYSVRQINANYLGPIMRIDNGYTEIDVYPLPGGDLDTESIIAHAKVNTITEAAGVSVWYDQSGNGNDAVQAINANQPLICENGAVFYENGKPALSFDGSNYLSFTQIDFTGDCLIAHIATHSAADSAYGHGGNNFGAYQNTTTELRWRFNGATYYATVPTITAGDQYLSLFRRESGTANMSYDGVDTTSQALSGTGSFSLLGASNTTSHNLLGKAQEYIFYTSAKNTTERHKIESNINTYFDIYPQTPTDLLLDKNPDAAAAYSLRKLRKTYAGPAVKVRRASDNVEADVYFDRNNEVSLESIVANVSETTTGSSQGSATFTLAVPTLGEFLGDASYVSGGATDGFVVVWYDQAKSNNAEQLAAASQPKIYDAVDGVVTDTQNKPVLSFSGGQQLLTGTMTAASQPVTAISFVDTTNSPIQAGWFYTLGQPQYAAIQDDGSRGRMYAGSSFVTGGSGSGANTRRLDFSLFDGANSEIYLNSISRLTGNPGSNGITSIRIGAFNNPSFNGFFGELIAYPTDQSANRTKIETDINNHYSIYQNTPEGGLLNQYGGAAAAYSLRALDFLYSGPLVRVRRDSDHVEADVYPDENGVFSERSFIDNVSETSTGVTVGTPNDSRAFRFGEFADGANCFVVEWKDQSGSANHATQNAAANQPKIYDATTGVITENGKPAVQALTQNGIYASNAIVQTTSTDIYSFSVFSLNNNTSQPSIWKIDEAGTINVATPILSSFVDRNETAILKYDSIPDVTAGPTTALNLAQQYLRGDVYKRNNDLEIFIDGASAASTTANNLDFTITGTDVYGLFESAPYGGYGTKIQEHIIWLSDQSANRSNIEDNINTFYKIY